VHNSMYSTHFGGARNNNHQQQRQPDRFAQNTFEKIKKACLFVSDLLEKYLKLFDADRGRREAEICVPSRHPTRGPPPRGIARIFASAIAVDVARPPRQ
jgi:hypothetical protein